MERKYHSNAKSYFTEVRQISDQLCRKYGLSVIQTNQGKAMHYAQWKAEAEGKPTWRTAIRMDIRDAIGVSFSWSQFVKEMEKRGLYLEAEPEVPILKNTGDGAVYSSAFLGKRIWGGGNPGEDPVSKDPTGVWEHADAVSETETHRTSETLLFLFISDGGISEEAQSGFPYAVRSDIRRLDQRICQMEFLQKEGITTREELAAYRKPLEEQVLSLMKERRELYRKEPGGMRIQEINGELKELRKKIRLSQQIEKQSLEMEERLRQAKEQEQEMSGKQRRETEWNR